MNDPGRKWLFHELPPWVSPDTSNYFITICCQHRGTNQLCLAPVGDALLAAARTYHDLHQWCPSLFLLMPDHIHMLVSFGREHHMIEVTGGLKRYISRHHGIVWQRNFFEHRLRSDESIEEKAAYIMDNPVRAGLVQEASAWPYVLMLH